MVVKVSDASGEGWVSAFNEEAEKIIGCSADELDLLKSQVTANVEWNIMQLNFKEGKKWELVPNSFHLLTFSDTRREHLPTKIERSHLESSSFENQCLPERVQ